MGARSSLLLVPWLLLPCVPACAGRVVQLDVNASPNYGEHSLHAGFRPTPARFPVLAGGEIDSGSLPTEGGGLCDAGRIDDHPDVRLVFADTTAGLRFTVEADADTTLAIHGPDGRWRCDDDSIGRAPEIVVRAPRPGRYNVFVGTRRQGAYPEAALLVSEIDP